VGGKDKEQRCCGGLIEVKMHNCGSNGGIAIRSTARRRVPCRVGKARGFCLVYVNSLCFPGLQFSILGRPASHHHHPEFLLLSRIHCNHFSVCKSLWLLSFDGHLLFSSTTCFWS
jgi:hypothetical protein